jgi:TetR/AcrR family transcriptional regulator, fatty acid metabolism regulator protein
MKKRDLQSLDTKQKIFNTALLFFDKKGYDHVSINEICEHLGLTKGAFYYHFNSKSAILLMKYQFNEITLQKYYRSIASEKPPEKLVKIIDRFINYLKITSLEEIKAAFKVQIDAHYQNFVAGDSVVQKSILMEIIQEGQMTGCFRKDISADLLADLIIRYKFGLYIEWCIKDGKMDLEDIGQREFGTLLNFLRC